MKEKSFLNQEAMELLRNLRRMKQTQQSWSTGKVYFKNPPHSQPKSSHLSPLSTPGNWASCTGLAVSELR